MCVGCTLAEALMRPNINTRASYYLEGAEDGLSLGFCVMALFMAFRDDFLLKALPSGFSLTRYVDNGLLVIQSDTRIGLERLAIFTFNW